ncbi:PREDICTED: uncharacterized protein LOC104568275 [Tinamus guttatus]|uniref:uncharacterized protein LOC104568275 n=1 Tax=Tinamus guttatus TaxID=94827 RepID=UPI00052EB4DC|nr:PREDICTED: uncharacterized protein LOC104568275 [Tinamus guttatus]
MRLLVPLRPSRLPPLLPLRKIQRKIRLRSALRIRSPLSLIPRLPQLPGVPKASLRMKTETNRLCWENPTPPNSGGAGSRNWDRRLPPPPPPRTDVFPGSDMGFSPFPAFPPSFLFLPVTAATSWEPERRSRFRDPVDFSFYLSGIPGSLSTLPNGKTSRRSRKALDVWKCLEAGGVNGNVSRAAESPNLEAGASGSTPGSRHRPSRSIDSQVLPTRIPAPPEPRFPLRDVPAVQCLSPHPSGFCSFTDLRENSRKGHGKLRALPFSNGKKGRKRIGGQQENHIFAARKAFDAFFSHYPYCYGYWKKYADMERRFDFPKEAEEVFERGLQSIPLSMDLWIHYISFLQSTLDMNLPESVQKIRGVFESAVAAAGMDFRSDKLWELYVEWEREQGDLRAVTGIYDRVLSMPTQLYNHHWEKFKEHVLQNSPRDILSPEELLWVRSKLATEPLPQPPEPGGGGARLERAQLRNWREYLDYEMAAGSHERTIVLFERCVIACALYEEFWVKVRPKSPEIAPKQPQIAPKPPEIAPKLPKIAPKLPKIAKNAPKLPKTAPKQP